MNQYEPVRYQIKIEGASLGVREAEEIGQAVAPLLGIENSLLVLDLSDVQRIDWYGLNAIATVADRARPKVEIVVCGANQDVAGLFHLVRLDRKLRMYPNLESACKALD